MMRRAFVGLATVTLLLAVAAVPAAGAGAPHNVMTENWCDLDDDADTGTGTVWNVPPINGIALNGRETYLEIEAWNVPGWIPGVHAPALWFGGHYAIYEDGVLVAEGWAPRQTPPGLESRVKYCLEVIPMGDTLLVWDPMYLVFTPPAVP